MTERLGVIAGSMFAGKTTELGTRIEKKEIADIKTQIFKPIIDERWGMTNKVRSHSGREWDAVSAENSADLLSKIDPDTKFVGIDEVQFFDEGIVSVIEELLNRDIAVVVAGLPLDFRGEPFGPMPVLLSKADGIKRLTAVCTHESHGKKCGHKATRTQRFVNGKPADYSDPVVVLGASESYAPRCPTHHEVPGKPHKH